MRFQCLLRQSRRFPTAEHSTIVFLWNLITSVRSISTGFDGNLHIRSLNMILYCSSIMIHINEEALKVTSKPPDLVDSHHQIEDLRESLFPELCIMHQQLRMHLYPLGRWHKELSEEIWDTGIRGLKCNLGNCHHHKKYCSKCAI